MATTAKCSKMYKWQLQLNAAKCKIISFGRRDVVEHEYTITSQNLAIPLGRDRVGKVVLRYPMGKTSWVKLGNTG